MHQNDVYQICQRARIRGEELFEREKRQETISWGDVGYITPRDLIGLVPCIPWSIRPVRLTLLNVPVIGCLRSPRVHSSAGTGWIYRQRREDETKKTMGVENKVKRVAT